MQMLNFFNLKDIFIRLEILDKYIKNNNFLNAHNKWLWIEMGFGGRI